MRDFQTPSKSSPKGGRRGCLCWDTNKYSVKCCDGSLRAQGIGRTRGSGASYFLDTFDGASAAYSLRKLRSAYSGNAIKIRRSSDSEELDIGFVNGVVDSASIISFCTGTVGYVTTWYDQSGNDRHAVAPTTTAQPKIYDISLGYLGYILFGGNQYLPTTLSYTFDGLIDIYQVVKANGSGVYGRTNLTNAYFGFYFDGGTSTTFTGFDQYTNKTNNVVIGNTADNIYDSTVNQSIYSVRARAKQSNTIWIGASFNSAFNNQIFYEYIIYKNQDRDNSIAITIINQFYNIYESVNGERIIVNQ